MVWRTVNFALEPLVADFAYQMGNTLFLVHSDGDRLVVMAENASKLGC